MNRKTRMGWGLGAVALALLVLPLLINLVRGGAGGVGVDPRVQGTDLVFALTFADVGTDGPLDGRIYLAVARSAEPEPRFQVSTASPGAYLFTRDVVAWRSGRAVELTDADPGSPVPSIAHILGGYYWVQAVLDLGGTPGAASVSEEGGTPGGSPDAASNGWSRRAGNLVSRPVEVFVDPRTDDVIRVHLARRITGEGPARPEP